MPGCNIMGVIHVSEEQMLHTAHAGQGFACFFGSYRVCRVFSTGVVMVRIV